MKRKAILAIILVVLQFISLHPQDTKKELDEIKKKIEGIDQKIKDLEKQKKSILSEIYGFELQYEKRLIERNHIDLQIQKTQQEIGAKESKRALLNREVVKSKDSIREILRIIYKIGGNLYLRLFIQIDSVGQLYRNYRLFQELIKFKSGEIEHYKKILDDLKILSRQLEEENRRLGGLREEKIQQIARVQSLRRAKVNFINKINRDKKKYSQMVDELNYQASRLIEVISGKKVKASLRVVDSKAIKGHLRWPVSGEVISRFGKKRSTQYNTYIINNGIKIRPSKGDEIHAVFSGDVAASGYYYGYGKLIVIQHSRDLYSVYGHCEQLLKKTGEHVQEGDVIGLVGNTGSTTLKALYFEIRENLKACDPLIWLKKSR